MKISIITPVCDSRVAMNDCIRSLSNQTYPFIEIIVVDYGKPDGTRQDVLTQLSNARYYDLGRNGKLSAALNMGIHKASGDVICILHPQDQLLEKGTIQKVVNAFNQSGANVVYGKGMTGNGKDILHTLRVYGSKPHSQKDLPFGKIPLHTSIYFKKEMLKELGIHKADKSITSEYELYLRMFMSPAVKANFLDEFVVQICITDVEKPKHTANKKIKEPSKKLQPSFLRRIAIT